MESKNEPKNVRVVLYAKVKAIDEQDDSIVPIGKVIIPRTALKTSQDCWFALSDAHLESRGTKSELTFGKQLSLLNFIGIGQVELDINYIPPDMIDGEHVFEVSVLRAKDLFQIDGGMKQFTGVKVFNIFTVTTVDYISNSYAYLHLLPQRKVKGMRTKSIPGTRNPQFTEKFTLYVCFDQLTICVINLRFL